MKVNKFIYSFLAGSVLIIASVFFPFLRYNFHMKGAERVKESYSLIGIKKLGKEYMGIGDVSVAVKIAAYILLAAGIIGVVLVLRYYANGCETWDIVNVAMAVTPVLSFIVMLIVKNNHFIKDVHEIMKQTSDEMIKSGFRGSAGYGLGNLFLICGGVLTLVSVVCFFALDKS